MTSNMIYIVALGVGFKCPRKIHLNTQWGGVGQVVTQGLLIEIVFHLLLPKFGEDQSSCPHAHRSLCVQMDFTRTFQTNTMCNNINLV